MLPENAVRVLGNSKSERITSLIMSVIRSGVQDIRLEDNIKAAEDELYDFMFENVYHNNAAKDEEVKAKMLVEKLFRYYFKNPDKMPVEYINIMNRFSKERAVCDYISGMSDGYAINLYNDLFVPKCWHIQ